jgi:hypothetical protein
MSGKESLIQEIFMQLIENFHGYYDAIDDELKGRSCAIIGQYLFIIRTFIYLQEYDNAIKYYSESIRHIHSKEM